MTLESSPKFLVALFVLAGAAGCGSSSVALKPAQLQKETAAQQQFKQQLGGMTNDQIAQTFRSDPRRARAMLMPPGMGDPHLRISPARTETGQSQN